MRKIKAIILAGGRGKRLRGISRGLPKPMVTIKGRPFLEYLILQLAKQNITEIIISVGFKKEVIKNFFEDGKRWNTRIKYSEEKYPLGTAGAFKKAVIGSGDNDFLVMNGDSFLGLDFTRIISIHKKKKALATLSLAQVKDISRYGKVEIDGQNRIINFLEKGSSGSGKINAGVYIFSREVADLIPEGEVSLEKDILPGLVGKRLFAASFRGFFVDIGIPRDLLRLRKNTSQLLRALRIK